MRIEITNIQPESERRFVFEAKLGNASVVGHLTEYDEGEIQGFNFEEEFFDVLFAFNGLGGRFTHDYWAYRNNEAKPFPWDYGNHDEEIVVKAVRESDTQLASLR